MANESYKGILNEVCKILFNEWDPIGIKDDGGPDNEYDTYASQVVGMLINGTTASEIQNYLDNAVRVRMEFEPNSETSAVVANKLMTLPDKFRVKK